MKAVTFFSDGERIAGDLYVPNGSNSARWPGVVICHGWGGLKERTVGEIALRLVAAGFAALTFDYRGYGQSDGRRGRLFPHEQAVDIRAATAYLRSVNRIDRSRIAVLGILTGAAAALQAASEDHGVAAVICFYPFGDGERWLSSLRSYQDWQEFVDRIEADRVTRSTSGTTELVDPNEILVRDPDGMRHEDRLRSSSPERRDWKLGLSSADSILTFRPEDHVHRITPRPVMIVAVEHDPMMPLDEVKSLYAKLVEPKRLLLLQDITHHDVYEPGRLTWLLGEVATFLEHAMPAMSAGKRRAR